MANELPKEPRYYHNQISHTPGPVPDIDRLRIAASYIKELLPPSDFPAQDASVNPLVQLEEYDLLTKAIGAVITPLTGDSTSPQDLYDALVCGPDAFEPSPNSHGLDPKKLTALVRNS